MTDKKIFFGLVILVGTFLFTRNYFSWEQMEKDFDEKKNTVSFPKQDINPNQETSGNKSFSNLNNLTTTQKTPFSCKKDFVSIICDIQGPFSTGDKLSYTFTTIGNSFDSLSKTLLIESDTPFITIKRPFIGREGKWVFSFKKNGKIVFEKNITTKEIL